MNRITDRKGAVDDTKTSKSDDTPEIFAQVEKRRWRKVRRLLKSSRGKELTSQIDKTGLSCIGVALGFQAPLAIIKLMISISPSLVDYRDSYGAGCLHVACLNGSSLDAIDYLLEAYPHLVVMRDNDGRVPLHHAVEFACQCQDEEDEEFCLEMIETLYNAKPETIHFVDICQDSPLDLIQMFKTTSHPSTYRRLDEIYRLARGFSVQEYIRQRKAWEEQGYDTTPTDKLDGQSCRSKETNTSKTSKTSASTASNSHFSMIKGSVLEAEIGDTDMEN